MRRPAAAHNEGERYFMIETRFNAFIKFIKTNKNGRKQMTTGVELRLGA